MKPIHLALATSLCLLASCEKKESAASTDPVPSSAPSDVLQRVLATTPQAAAQEIHLIRTTAKPGEEITIGGRIMGNEKPFIEGRAVFTLGDPTILKACNEIPDDKCETPWDNCCDTKEQKLIGLATVQVVGPDGRVLKESLQGVGGLQKLGRVIVSGKVAEGSTSESLVVNASAIQVQ